MVTEVPALAQISAGFFLFLSALETGRYLSRELGLRWRWLQVSAPVFASLLLAGFGLSGAFTIALGPQNLLLALALGLGLCLSFVHPVAAAAVFASNLLLRPWEAVPGQAVLELLPRLLAGGAVASWIAHRFLSRQLTFVWNRDLTVFTLLFGWLLFSALISPYSDENLGGIFRIFLPIYISSLLLMNVPETPRDIDFLTRSLSLAITGVIAGAIATTVTDPKFVTDGLRLRWVGLSANSNDLAALAVMAFPFLLVSVLQKRATGALRLVEIGSLAVLLAGLVLTKSRAGMLSLGGAIFIYALLTSLSPRRILAYGALLVPVMAIFMKVAMSRSAADLDGSTESRLNYIITGFRMLRSHPFFGVGVNNYPRFYDRFTLVYLETGERTAHSTWMLFLSETGVIGLGLFLLLAVATATGAWRLRKSRPEFLLAVVAYGINMSVLSHAYTFYPYVLMSLVLSALRVTVETSALASAGVAPATGLAGHSQRVVAS